MRSKDTMQIPTKIHRILLAHSDENHPITLAEIHAYLEDDDIEVDRRTIYKAFNILNQDEDVVHRVKIGRTTGYYCEHVFDPIQTFIMLQTIQNAKAISTSLTSTISKKLQNLMSESQFASLPESLPTEAKTNENDVLPNIRKLIPAIQEKRVVSFRYFDLNSKKEKVYRREKPYRMVPYAILTNDGKFYCVFYNENHNTFNNFRLDKMDHLILTNTISDNPQHFNLKDYIRTTFDMYSGESRTIQGEFDNDFFHQLYDKFGNNIIVQKRKENTFIASIRTTITPTLISWLLLFHDRMVITAPDELIDDLLTLANDIQNKYRKA